MNIRIVFSFSLSWPLLWTFLCGHMCSVLLAVFRSEITWSYDKSMFNHLRSLQTVFPSGFTVVCSYQQCLRVPISPHHHQHFLLSDFLKFCFFFFLAVPLGFWDLSPQPGIKHGPRQQKLRIPIARPPGNSLLSDLLMTTVAVAVKW